MALGRGRRRRLLAAGAAGDERARELLEHYRLNPPPFALLPAETPATEPPPSTETVVGMRLDDMMRLLARVEELERELAARKAEGGA